MKPACSLVMGVRSLALGEGGNWKRDKGAVVLHFRDVGQRAKSREETPKVGMPEGIALVLRMAHLPEMAKTEMVLGWRRPEMRKARREAGP